MSLRSPPVKYVPSYNMSSDVMPFGRLYTLCSFPVRGSVSCTFISIKNISRSLACGRKKGSALQHFFIRSAILGGAVAGISGLLLTRGSHILRKITLGFSPSYGSLRAYISNKMIPVAPVFLQDGRWTTSVSTRH